MNPEELIAATETRPWNPEPFWESAGDSLFYYFRNLSHEEQRIDDYLTVFRADVDGDLVGIQIKGFMHLLRTKPVLRFIFEDRTTKLGLIALAVRGVSAPVVPDDVRDLVYDQVLDLTAQKEIMEPILS